MPDDVAVAAPPFHLNDKQQIANAILAASATHILGYGGSRSGKTFLFCRAIATRAIMAPYSRHAIMRFRFNACKQTIGFDTFPKMMQLCYPQMRCELSKSDWFFQFGNGSEVWLGGLDDKERTEKVLGFEFATIFLNECSQIPYESRNTAVTRLAQKVNTKINGVMPQPLKLRMYYDENPPDKGHWSYRMFLQKVDPETRAQLRDPSDFASFQINPEDNSENLPGNYLDTLRGLSQRMQKRFLKGEFRDENPNALFPQEWLDKWRVESGARPDLVRVVVAVDPSGAGDVDNADNDAIGIVVAGLGTDGNGYLLEDITVKAGPATWGNVACSAYERHEADALVAEVNYGGAMVKMVVKAANPRVNYKEVKASRGKIVRAEPIAALCEIGKIRLVGQFNELEDELAGFTTNGFIGERSPNRGDAFVWAFAELFPGIVMPRAAAEPEREVLQPGGWMGA